MSFLFSPQIFNRLFFISKHNCLVLSWLCFGLGSVICKLCLIALPIGAICKWIAVCFFTGATQRVYAANFGQLRSFLTKHNIGYQVIALYVVSFTILASIFVTVIHCTFFFGGLAKRPRFSIFHFVVICKVQGMFTATPHSRIPL